MTNKHPNLKQLVGASMHFHLADEAVGIDALVQFKIGEHSKSPRPERVSDVSTQLGAAGVVAGPDDWIAGN